MKTVQVRDLNPLLIKGANFAKEDAVMARKDGYMPLLRANNIKDMHINFDEVMYVKRSVVKDEQHLQDGDVIFVTSSGSKHLVGKSALVSKLTEPTTIGAFNSLLRFPHDVDPRYLFYSLNSPSFTTHIGSRLAGANINNIKKDDILDFDLAVPFRGGKPNLVEQKRIADELDVVLGLRETAGADAKSTGNLFDSIANNRFESAMNDRTITLDEVCHITKGSSPTIKTKPGEYPLVVTAAERKTADNYQFDDEAVCIPLVSSTGHGHASLHRIHYQEGKFALANIMVALTAKDKSEVLMKYLYYYLLHYRNELFVPLMRGVANVTIPFGSIGQVEVRLPEIEDQKRMVTLFNEVQQLEGQLQHRNKLINHLVRSVMNETFAMQT